MRWKDAENPPLRSYAITGRKDETLTFWAVATLAARLSAYDVPVGAGVLRILCRGGGVVFFSL